MKTDASTRDAQKIEAVKTIHAEFERILSHAKCRECACFYGDVLNYILEKIKTVRQTFPHSGLAGIERDFKRWIADADALNMHG